MSKEFWAPHSIKPPTKDVTQVQKTSNDEIASGAYRRETEQDELMHEYSERRALERDSVARARRPKP